MDSLIQKAQVDEGNVIAKKSIKTIESGDLAPLSDATKKKRLSGTSDYLNRGHKPKRTTDMTPLKYTGRLINSIEVTDKGVDMFDYGKFHNEGIGEPKREFIAKPGSSQIKTEEIEVAKRFVNSMNRTMKK